MLERTSSSEVRIYLLSLVSLMKSGFGFSSCPDGLNIMYGGNVFGHATLKNDFLVLDLDNCYNNSPFLFSQVLILILNLLNGMLGLVILAKIG